MGREGSPQTGGHGAGAGLRMRTACPRPVPGKQEPVPAGGLGEGQHRVCTGQGSRACSRPSGLNEGEWAAKDSQTHYETERWQRAEHAPAGRWAWDTRLWIPGTGALATAGPQRPAPMVVSRRAQGLVSRLHFSERLLERNRMCFVLSQGSVARLARCH